jgi:protein-S-isoprenylcysteine O-methyltransferase Ste14
MLRALDEEKTLARDLKGYKEYMQQVKYRLLPGIW